jgi:NADP-dependent alcohol dehydrogenase
MKPFTYHNPVKLIFGENSIPSIKREIPANARLLLTYGGGSIKKNGVYDAVRESLIGYTLFEFGLRQIRTTTH